MVTSRLETAFHVRLVAPLEKRARHIEEMDHLDPKAALEFIEKEDHGRKRYLKKFYQKDINDPLLYHVTVNTDLVGYERTAKLIADLVLDEEWAQRIYEL